VSGERSKITVYVLDDHIRLRFELFFGVTFGLFPGFQAIYKMDWDSTCQEYNHGILKLTTQFHALPETVGLHIHLFRPLHEVLHKHSDYKGITPPPPRHRS
jgi:hypothetical protein